MDINITENLRLISLVELPRRIFLKSDADLRSSILVCAKPRPEALKRLLDADYPIHAELVRKVGYKLGAGYSVTPKRDPETGDEKRDDNNELIPDTDFLGVEDHFAKLADAWCLGEDLKAQLRACYELWIGGRISDVLPIRNLT